LEGAVGFVNHEDLDLVSLEKAEAFLDRGSKSLRIAGVERGGATPELCGKDEFVLQTLPGLAKGFLAVRIGWGGVDIRDSKALGAADDPPGFLHASREGRSIEGAEGQFADLQAG
jgi:hypothetical protein